MRQRSSSTRRATGSVLLSLEARREAHQQRAEDLRAAAVDRAARLRAGLRDGLETVIEDFAKQAIELLELPDGIGLEPKTAYRRDPRELVMDVRLPDMKVLPTEKSVKYVHARRSFTVKERSQTELASIYRNLLAALPLCVAHLLFSSLDVEVLDSVTVNGILPTIDSATGRPVTRYLVSVTTGRATSTLSCSTRRNSTPFCACVSSERNCRPTPSPTRRFRPFSPSSSPSTSLVRRSMWRLALTAD